MASREHWNVTDERDMWLKVVGKEAEDRAETILQAGNIFADIPAGNRCLEIGCGCGRFAIFAFSRFEGYRGVDISESIVNYFLHVFKNESQSLGIHITDGTFLPFVSNYFDFVFSFTCFQHMPTLDMVQVNLREAYRVLAPGGLCRIQTVQGTPDPDYFDGWVFPSPEAFAKEFTDVGFEIVDAHTEDLWIWVTAKK